ncbi:hypothetical protein Plec18167_006075 [Paecilomyces lecythidis]|uniref:Uncharacterized protein n=1 Tax=Paecilomyces lecythidis TaxID=3004212 RepID=A0ABR3XDZ8_9EURO
MQSVLGACKTHRLTNDVEPEAVEHSREYPEVILQADEGPIQREGQSCERNREASEKDVSTAADASPCDSIPSLDPLRTERRFHPRPPEPVSSEQATIGTIPQAQVTLPGVIPDSQERVSIMNTNTIEQKDSPSKSNSGNESSKMKSRHVLKPIPRGRLKELFERKAHTADSVDWDEDLRIPESEPERPSSKRAKKSPAHLPSPGGSRKKNSVPSRRNKAQPKTSLPTPKTGTASSKKSRTSEKAPVQNTLASCRPRRAAADEAKIRLLCDHSQDENTDDDPIEDSTPDDNIVFGDSFHFDQQKTSTPRAAHSDKSKNVETKTPVIDLTTASDGINSVRQEISAQSITHSPASSDSGLSPVEDEDRDIQSRVEERQKDELTGRGHLIGSKLAAVLGEHGILSSGRASEEPTNVESQQPHTSPANVEYDQPLNMNEKLAKIPNQVSEFTSRKHDDTPDNIHDSLGLSESSVTSEENEMVLSNIINHVAQEEPEGQKPIEGGASITKSWKPLRNSEGLSTDSHKDSSRPIRPGDSTANKTIGHPYAALIDERLHRKTHIVSFSADGPRNQCEIHSSSVQRIRSPRLQSVEEREAQPKRKIFTEPFDNHTRPAKRLRFDFAGSSDMEGVDSSSSAATGHMHTVSSPSPLKNNLFRRSMVDEYGSPHPGHRAMAHNVTSRKELSHRGNVERQTGIRQDISSAATTDSSPLSYASRDTEVEPSSPTELQGVRKYLPKGELPASIVSNVGRKQRNDANMAGWGPQRQSNPLLVAQKQMPGQTRESLFPLAKQVRGDQVEIGHVQEEQVAKEQQAQLSTFWDSISNLTKKKVRKEDTSKPDGKDGNSRGSTIESSSPSGRSETSESITLVEPDAQEAQWGQLFRASHRSTLDILVDTSERLVRHLVEEEDAVWDVLATYDHGCRRLIDQLTEAHNESLEVYTRQVTAIRTEYKEIREKTLERLKASDKVLKVLPTMNKLAAGMKKREKLLARLQNLSNAYDAKLNELEAPK